MTVIPPDTASDRDVALFLAANHERNSNPRLAAKYRDLVPHCEICLEHHFQEDGCKCANCGCGLHGLFARRVVVNGERKIWCPRCDDAIPL